MRSVDFERVMAAPGRAKTRHFVLHHLVAVPSLPGAVRSSVQTDPSLQDGASTKLSTAARLDQASVVDDSAPKPPSDAIWLGLVVPKRHAKRSVTRQLLKRQMRAAVGDQQSQDHPLSQGLWVLRLRAAFDVSQYPSAASAALAAAARQELAQLLQRAAHPTTAGAN